MPNRPTPANRPRPHPVASVEAWTGNSALIRNWIRAETVPAQPEIAACFPCQTARRPRANVIEEIAERLLGKFAVVCVAHGSETLMLMTALVRARGEGSRAAVARAGRTAGVLFNHARCPGRVRTGLFPHRFHLDQDGFSPRLVDALKVISQN